MKCDQCTKEANEGVSDEWIGVSVASTSTYGATLGPGTVIETTYDNFIPIPTFLCEPCYGLRAKKARRSVVLSTLFGLVGIGLLVLAYILLVSDFDIPVSVFWTNLSGWLAVLVGFLLVKFSWSELTLRGEILRKTDTRMERHDVFFPYANKKAKEIGCAQVWDSDTFKSISSSNERAKEHDRLLSQWERGVITEDEYREKVKQI